MVRIERQPGDVAADRLDRTALGCGLARMAVIADRLTVAVIVSAAIAKRDDVIDLRCCGESAAACTKAAQWFAAQQPGARPL